MTQQLNFSDLNEWEKSIDPEVKKKCDRMSEFAEMVREFIYHREPKLTIDDIAFVLSEEIEDMTEFFKKYKKYIK